MLLTIDNVLNIEELSCARHWLQEASWQEGSATAGAQAATVKNNLQLPAESPYLQKLRQLVLEALQRNAIFFSAVLPKVIMPPFFNCYGGAANHYGRHVDSAVRSMADGRVVRCDVSATLFLSEPEEYDGGVLMIDDTFGRHGIKLPAGSMVVYPSSSVHQVTPVTRGARLASFMFIQSLVPETSRRRVLYDMDMALLELRAQLGETAPLVSLTGTYHNLLREWAHT